MTHLRHGLIWDMDWSETMTHLSAWLSVNDSSALRNILIVGQHRRNQPVLFGVLHRSWTAWPKSSGPSSWQFGLPGPGHGPHHPGQLWDLRGRHPSLCRSFHQRRQQTSLHHRAAEKDKKAATIVKRIVWKFRTGSGNRVKHGRVSQSVHATAGADANSSHSRRTHLSQLGRRTPRREHRYQRAVGCRMVSTLAGTTVTNLPDCPLNSFSDFLSDYI